MKNFGRYSELNEAHRRANQQTQLRKEMHVAGKEITDRKAERRDRDQAVPQRAKQAERGRDAATSPAQPDRPVEARPRTLVPDSPAPGESEGHFVWRQLTTQRIERDSAREEAREADRIPRILRTEKSPIGRSTELKAALDRLEAEEARRAATTSTEKEVPPKKEIEAEP